MIYQDEFNEEDLQKIIQEALELKGKDNKFFQEKSPGFYLGFMETELIENFHNKISGHVPDSFLLEVYRELRTDILSRKESISVLDLHTATKNCRKCNLSEVVPELPKWNVVNPSVMFIVESPNISSEAVELFLKSLKTSGFDSSKVCLTYVNRCPAKKKFNEQEIANCLPYLHSEIQLLNPKLIVTLGLLPLVSLLGTEVKMKDYRGNIFWLGHWPILPSYSPMYALKSGKQQITQFITDIKTAYTFVDKEEKIS
jgi:DNA polymerase